MVNLNANRNLPQESTPWGKSIDRRIADLEREFQLIKSRTRNNERNLNVVTTGVYDRSLYSVYDYDSRVKFSSSEVANTDIKTIGPTITGTSRTGRLYVSAPIPLEVSSVTPTQDSGSHSGYVTVRAIADTMGPPQVSYDFEARNTFYITIHKIGSQSLIYSGGAWNFPFMGALLVRPGDFSISFDMEIRMNNFDFSTDWYVGANVSYNVLAL